MEFSQKLILLFVLLLPLVCSADPIYQLCSQNMTENGIWLDNSDVGLKEIMAKTPSSGYALSSVGNGTEAFYGLAQCRGDISPESCSYCINEAVKQLRGSCPESESARIWKKLCFLRYQTRNFFGSVDDTDVRGWYTTKDARDPAAFKAVVWSLLGRVRAGAVATNNKFGMGNTSFVNGGKDMTVYGMAQCTPDLHGIICAQCLYKITSMMESYCEDRDGCIIKCSSCWAMFENYNFLDAMVTDYFPSAPSPSPIAA